MTQPDPTAVALEAIAEGMNILQLLAYVTDNIQWINDSAPLGKLNELAQSLGHHDAQSVHTHVEGDRQDEMDTVTAQSGGPTRRYAMNNKTAQADWNDDGLLGQARAELAQTCRLAALVTPEMAALLERLGTAWTVGLDDKGYALTLAARIREALARETGGGKD